MKGLAHCGQETFHIMHEEVSVARAMQHRRLQTLYRLSISHAMLEQDRSYTRQVNEVLFMRTDPIKLHFEDV